MCGAKQLLWAAACAASLVFGQRARADVFGSGANSFSIDFVTVGNPGNLADTVSVPFMAGSVSYAFRMGTYEISEQMIDKANALGGLGITKDTRGPNKPATGISWFEAAQFVNWLNTSTGNHAAYKFDAGGNFQLWQASDPGYLPGPLFRNTLAKYFLPSVDEWYKAAYYDPVSGVYYDYPTGSNAAPTPTAGGTVPGTAVFQSSPADITQAGGLSPYGTMAQGGNAAEWNETSFDKLIQLPTLGGRSYRGGDWAHFVNDLASFSGNQPIPAVESDTIGFRIVSIVPEPTGADFIAAASIATIVARCRIGRRHHNAV
jgi:hypothetical protein